MNPGTDERIKGLWHKEYCSMRSLIHAALIAGLTAAPIAPLAAAKLTPEAQLAKLVEGRTAGKPVDCINLGISSNDSQKIPGLAMAYRQGTTWYVSRFQDGCPQLREDTILITRMHSSQLCRGDFAELRESGGNFPLGTCIFDSFTPYRKE
jgi:hypothetical protein